MKTSLVAEAGFTAMPSVASSSDLLQIIPVTMASQITLAVTGLKGVVG